MQPAQEVEEFAAHLRVLKDRAGRSYDALARRIGISSSALHRYCSGSAVPQDSRVVEALGRICGADREELLELRGRWVRALSAWERQRTEAAGRAGSAEAAGPENAAVRESAAGSPDAAGTGGAPGGRNRPLAWWRSHRLVGTTALAGAAALILLSAAVAVQANRSEEPTGPDDRPMLLSKSCPPVIAMGEQDACVRELQTLLERSGGPLAIDSIFGSETLMRVVAFQLFAGLPTSGVADEPTKKALYAGKVRLSTWPAQRVEKRIREVFTEDPETAVKIARCHSKLDPLYILSNPDGSRHWGVFQLHEHRLRELGGSPRQALDPVWNIKAAHALWKRTRDFTAWGCIRYETAVTTTGSP